MTLVRLGLSLQREKPMLRLVLLLLYLIASSSLVPLDKQGGGIDPLGLNPPPPPQTEADQGGGIDPLG
jgi:hypothetical protein